MSTQRLLVHLIELRQRLIRALSAVFVIFIVLFYFSQSLFHYLALPLLGSLPHGNQLIATGIAAPLIVPLKFSFALAFVLAAPVILYEFWAFIAPALYRHEKKLLWLLLVPSVALFYLGLAFAYWLVFPLIFKFFASVVPEGVNLLPDISQYLSFAIKLFIAFGLAFQVPVITLVLVWTGVTTVKQLSSYRPYIIVLAFILGMLLTPPDVVSQVLLAVPMCLLFEIGLLIARFVVPVRQIVSAD